MYCVLSNRGRLIFNMVADSIQELCPFKLENYQNLWFPDNNYGHLSFYFDIPIIDHRIQVKFDSYCGDRYLSRVMPL